MRRSRDELHSFSLPAHSSGPFNSAIKTPKRSSSSFSSSSPADSPPIAAANAARSRLPRLMAGNRSPAVCLGAKEYSTKAQKAPGLEHRASCR